MPLASRKGLARAEGLQVSLSRASTPDGVGQRRRLRDAPRGWLRRWAWVSLPVGVVAVTVTSILPDVPVWNPPLVLPAMHWIFLTGMSLAVALLAVRSFLNERHTAVAFLGSGALALGLGSAIGGGLAIYHPDVNWMITVSNFSAWLSAACHALCFVVGAATTKPAGRTGIWVLAACYGGVALAVGAVAMGAVAGVTPVFFVDAVGPTAWGVTLLWSAAGMFASAALYTSLRHRTTPSALLYWYGLGMALIAVGLAGLALQTTVGCPLNWAARLSEYAGSVCLLAAVLHASRETAAWGVSLAAAMQNREDQFQALFEQASDGIFVADAQGRYSAVNHAGCEMLGYTRDELSRKSIADVVLPEEWPRIGPEVARLAGGDVVISEWRFLRSDGTTFIGEVTARQLPDGRLQALLRDVTARKAAQEALQASERRYRQLVESVPAMLWAADAQGNTTDHNRRWYDYSGETPEEARGYSWVALVHPDDRERTKAAWEEAIKAGTVHEAEFRLRRASDGAYRWHSVRVVPRRDDVGRIAGWFGTCVDIDDRRRTEEALRTSERVYRAIGESINYGVWVCDPAGKNLYASESFLKLVGLTQEECSSFGWGKVLHPADAERTINAWKHCVATGGTWDIEHRFLGTDGAYHFILARGVPVRNEAGEITCWAGINLDISSLKKAQAELREAKEAAEVASAAKDQFLAALSHELRTPLSPALLILANECENPAIPEEVRKELQIARQNIELEVRIIDDLLDLSRVTTGKMRLHPSVVSVAEVVRRALEVCAGDFLARNITVVEDFAGCEGLVMADAARLQQVLWNLLKNAAKFTPPRGEVRVRCMVAGPRVRLQVEDTGVGMSPQAMRRIFTAFEQPDSGSRQFGGLGLGLAISKAIVAMHGGTITAESAGVGKGTTFTVELPRVEGELQAPKRPPNGDAAGAAGRSGRTSALRLLLVEDHPDTARTLGRLLRSSGHHVQTVGTVAGALERLAEESFDVLLSDLGLPDGNGHDLMREARERFGIRGVCMSGYGMEADLAKSRDAGFLAHLTKPIDYEQLEKVLGDLAV